MQKALDIVADIRGAEATVLHVEEAISHPYEIPTYEHSPEGHKKLHEQHQKVLAEAAKLFEEKNIKVDTELKQGHPAYTIMETASEGNYNLIVMGSRGLGGFKKLLLGSVSNAVVQEADTNVLIVK